MNFKRNSSKISLLSTSSGKSIPASEDEINLQTQITNLKQTVHSLKLSIRNRDVTINTISREKEKLYSELKSTQRSNRNLHQQLEDERGMHSKEKQYMIEEFKRLSKKAEQHLVINQNKSVDEESCNTVNEEIKSKDEIIYNICAKYLKIKSSKIVLQKKYKRLQLQCHKACEKIVMLLQENRNTLDVLLSTVMENFDMPLCNKNYLRLLKMNADLHYENTEMKVFLTLLNPSNEKKKEYNYIKSKSKGRYGLKHKARASLRCKSYNNFNDYNRLYIRNKKGAMAFKSNSEPCFMP